MLTHEEFARYGRQMIVDGVGRTGQERLKASKVVVVGAGGLGSPCALYLASAGVGTIGIVDYDSVDESNLQRQVIHTEASAAAGRSKVDSACDAIARLNHFVRCVPHHVLLGSTTALQVLGAYDIVVDATDNAATRYLLNDACVMLGKPLVSGSALRMEGQLTVYNYAGGPCYRCLFPTPPPAASVTNCADGGVLGPVTGVIGTMQAMEVLKIAMGQQPAYAQKMLLYDATDGSFRQLKLRPRNENCIAPTLKELIDYELFCGSGALDKTPAVHLLAPHEEIEPKLLAPIIHDRFLLDVRNTTQFGICALPDSKNIPLAALAKQVETVHRDASGRPIVVVCRRGNDSQEAVRVLQSSGVFPQSIVSLAGGLDRWSDEVDPSFPKY